MKKPNSDTNHFLDFKNFETEKAYLKFPHAKEYLTGSISICHAGINSNFINENIASPVNNNRFKKGYFFYNKGSGGAKLCRELVMMALLICDKFLVVISNACIGHDWVVSELDWAINNKPKIIVCLIDDTKPIKVHPKLSLNENNNDKIITIDFYTDIKHA